MGPIFYGFLWVGLTRTWSLLRNNLLWFAIRNAYSQCDDASPCSSCFFLLRASMRSRAEQSSQMFSDVVPHTRKFTEEPSAAEARNARHAD